MSYFFSKSNFGKGANSGIFLELWLPLMTCVILLCLELYALLYDISSPVLHGHKTKEDPIAVFQNAKNNVQLKSFGTMIWGTPEEGEKLYQGDSIATLQSSEAIVSFSDQSEIVVEPESLIIIEEAPKAETPHAERKIIARLVKGSITRRKSGSTPLFIKFSQNAAPVRLDDSKGNSIFRVIHRGYGIEVVVESGSVKLDLKQEASPHQSVKIEQSGAIQVTPVQKLSPPKLKRPKIEINRSASCLKGSFCANPPVHLLPVFSLFSIPEAMAQEVATVSVQFDWEPIKDADSYLIQISPTPDFHTIAVENKTHELSYTFRTKAPETLTTYYFRVAAINVAGEDGEFSSIEKVEIHPVEQPQTETQPESKLESKPVTKPVSKPVPQPVSRRVSKPVSKPMLRPKPKPVPQPKFLSASQPKPKAVIPPMQPRPQLKPLPKNSHLVSRDPAAERHPLISSTRQFGFFENTVLQSNGASFSPGIVWWPSITWGKLDLGIGIDASLLKKAGGAGFFVGSNFVGHLGLMGTHWGIEGFTGLSAWFGYGGTSWEYGLKIKRTVRLGFIDGLFLEWINIPAVQSTQEVQLGVFFNL